MFARNRLRLAALFRAKAGICAWQVDQADHGALKLLCDLHAAQRLAVALGMRHAEVAPHAVFGAAALAVADDQHFIVAQAGHAASHGLVVAIGAIPVNLAEIREDPLDKVHGVGPLRMPSPFDPDPRRRNRRRLCG